MGKPDAFPSPARFPTGCEVAVVGGGIAGLAAAWELRDRDVLLLEASDRVGGRIRSVPQGRYWLNFGAHLFPEPNTYLGGLTSQLGLKSSPVRGTVTAMSLNGRTLTRGRLETYPFRLKLPLAARASLVRLGLRLRSDLADYGRATAERPGETPDEHRMRALAYRNNVTFADYLGPIHPEVSAIVRAAVNRVAAEPDQLAAGAGLALFEFAGTIGDRHGAAHRRNLVGGSALLPYALADALGDRAITNARVASISQNGGVSELCVWSGGSEHRIRADAVVLATPAPEVPKLVHGLPENVADAIRQIVYGPYVVGAFLTKERARMPWDHVYAMVAPKKSFNMFFNVASVTRNEGDREPGGSLMVYGAGELARSLLDKSDSGVIDLFLRDLSSIYPNIAKVVADVSVHRWKRGIPHTRPGRARIQSLLDKPVGNICLAGDYTAGFPDMETAALSGARAAQLARTLAGHMKPSVTP